MRNTLTNQQFLRSIYRNAYPVFSNAYLIFIMIACHMFKIAKIKRVRRRQVLKAYLFSFNSYFIRKIRELFEKTFCVFDFPHSILTIDNIPLLLFPKIVCHHLLHSLVLPTHNFLLPLPYAQIP